MDDKCRPSDFPQEDANLQDFISRMPKVELHAHLNGCIRESTLFDLAKERNIQLSSHHFGEQPSPTADVYSYSYMYNVQPRSLQDCFDMFAEIPKCVDDRDSLERITREALHDFAQHHVVYLELRSTPKRLKNMTKRDYVETVLSVMKAFEQAEELRYQTTKMAESAAVMQRRLPMKCRFIVTVDRSNSPADAGENVDLAIDLFQRPGSMVVGVDVGGNPTRNDLRDFMPPLKRARNAGLKVTIHCAEVVVGDSTEGTNPQLVKSFLEVSAIFQFRPDRLGHALLLPDSLRSVLMNDLKIPVESCPTSNVMTLELAKHMGGNLIQGLQQHPQLVHWLQAEYPISIGTDDPGVFNTNATQELLLLARACNLKENHIERIVNSSLDHAFCDESLKRELRNRIASHSSITSTIA